MLPHRLTVAALVVLACYCSQPAHGAEFDTEIGAMLDAAWKPSIQGLKTSQSVYNSVAQRAPGDLRVKYGFALVLMKNRRYDEATKLLGEILDSDKTHVSARRARAWVAMLTKKYTAALVDLEYLSQQMPAESTLPDDAPWRELAGFLGRMFGFLEGPAAAAVPNNVVEEYQTKICARLSESRLAAYNTGFREVADRFAQFSDDQKQTQAEAKADAQQQREKDRQALDENRAQVANEDAAIKAEAEKKKAEGEKELAELEAKAAPLQSAFNRLQTEAANWGNQIAAAQNDQAILVDLANRARDPIERDRLLAQASVIGITINRLGANLNRVNVDLANVNSQLGVLEGQRRALFDRYGGELQRLASAQNDLRKVDKRLNLDERRLKEPITGNTPRTRTISAVAAALPTYDEFPFERERARLLNR